MQMYISSSRLPHDFNQFDQIKPLICFKMKTSSVISIFFTFCLFADAFGGLAGGYLDMDKNSENFRDLKSDLEKSNFGGGSRNGVKVQQVVEAQQQIVAGTNYRILGKIEVNGQSSLCCFKAFRSLDGDFSVQCVDYSCQYPRSKCFE